MRPFIVASLLIMSLVGLQGEHVLAASEPTELKQLLDAAKKQDLVIEVVQGLGGVSSSR